MFSTLSFLKNKLRNRLTTHLSPCVCIQPEQLHPGPTMRPSRPGEQLPLSGTATLVAAAGNRGSSSGTGEGTLIIVI